MNSQSRSTSSGCTQSALKNKLYLIVCYVRVCVCVSLLRIRNARIYGCICTYNRLLDNCHFVSLAIFYVDWLRRQVQLQVEQGRRRTKARQLIYGIAINYCRTLSAWAAEGGARRREARKIARRGHNNWTTWCMRNKARESLDKCAYTSENSSRRGKLGSAGGKESYCGCTCCQHLLTVGKNNANLFYSTPI